MRLAASPWRTIMPSEARLTITFTNSRSSLHVLLEAALFDLERAAAGQCRMLSRLIRSVMWPEEEGEQQGADVRTVDRSASVMRMILP